MRTAILVIDVQKGMFAFPDMQPHNGLQMITALNAVTSKARKSNAPVIFIQHDGGAGHPTDKNTIGFELAESLITAPDDIFITKKQCGSFLGTDLNKTLKTLGIGKLVIGGMQTEFCVDTAIRTALDHGYEVCVIENGHSTFDNGILPAAKIIAHHSQIWKQGFGSVVAEPGIQFE